MTVRGPWEGIELLSNTFFDYSDTGRLMSMKSLAKPEFRRRWTNRIAFQDYDGSDNLNHYYIWVWFEMNDGKHTKRKMQIFVLADPYSHIRYVVFKNKADLTFKIAYSDMMTYNPQFRKRSKVTKYEAYTIGRNLDLEDIHSMLSKTYNKKAAAILIPDKKMDTIWVAGPATFFEVIRGYIDAEMHRKLKEMDLDAMLIEMDELIKKEDA